MRSIPRRTLGSGTRLVEEFPVPLLPYHAGRLVAWAWRRPQETGCALLVVALWGLTGSLVAALLLAACLLALGLTGWLLWRRRRGEAAAISVGSAFADLRRRRQLARQWDLACESAGLLGPRRGGPPRLRGLTGTDGGGLRARMAPGRIGIPVGAVIKAAPTLAEVIGCRDVVVTATGPGLCTVNFHWTDPVGRSLTLTQLPLAPRGQLAYGVRGDGAAAAIRVNQSVLLTGLTRHGKSNAVRTLLAAALAARLPLDLYVSDPKGGIELALLSQRVGEQLGSLRVRQYVDTPEATPRMVADAEKAMQCRMRAMRERGQSVHTPTPEEPLVCVILDELLPLEDMLKQGVKGPLGRILYIGGAAGYIVIMNAQVAQMDVVGRIRNLVPQRLCFATDSAETTKAALGVAAPCHELRAPGVGYSCDDSSGRPEKFRVPMVAASEWEWVASGRLPRGIARPEGTETALYRWYAEDDTLLYVGITNDVARRTEEHHEGKPWWPQVARNTVEWHPTRQTALAAEKKAIQEERPVYNRVHSLLPRRFVA